MRQQGQCELCSLPAETGRLCVACVEMGQRLLDVMRNTKQGQMLKEYAKAMRAMAAGAGAGAGQGTEQTGGSDIWQVN